MESYLKDFRGIADGGAIQIDATKTVRLPDNECRMCYVVRWNATNDGDYSTETAGADQLENSDLEVYWGVNGKLLDQLFPGRRSPMLHINNTNQIVVSNPKAGETVTIYYVYFR